MLFHGCYECGYWNRWQADRILSQALANILVDWVWCSGRWGIVIPQGVLGVKPDGIVGERTLQRLNSYPEPEILFGKIKQMRSAYLNMICIDRSANKRFLKGWLNRLNDFRWIPMAILFCVMFSSCRTAKMETTKQTMVETLHATSLHAEQKTKPTGIPVGWWIAGGVAIALLFFAGWKWK